MKIILTGATGMVGEGVLIECLADKNISEILIINRKSAGVSHPKLKEIIHADFFDLSKIESQLSGFDACLFCLGVSSVGMKEAEYTKLTYDLTLNFAKTLLKFNKNMTFCYISGASTDSTEKGNSMWARVKGKTENDLTKLGFKAAYNFRPGALIATDGQKNLLSFYKYLSWLVPVIKFISPNSICSIRELGLAMLNASKIGYEKQILEVSDIKKLAAK